MPKKAPEPSDAKVSIKRTFYDLDGEVTRARDTLGYWSSLTYSNRGWVTQVTDAKGNTANVTIANVYQKNGVIHVVDKVLMP